MAGVFNSYESQFASITADITARIGRIPSLTGSERGREEKYCSVDVYWYVLSYMYVA